MESNHNSIYAYATFATMSVDFQTLISPCDSNDTIASYTEPFEPIDVERLLESRRYWLEQNSTRFSRHNSIDNGSRSSRSSIVSQSSFSVVTETRSGESSQTESEIENSPLALVKILCNETLVTIFLNDISIWAIELGFPGAPLTVSHLLCYLKFVRQLPHGLNQLQLLHMGRLYKYNDSHIQLESLNLGFPMHLRINLELPPIRISPLACLASQKPKKLLWIGRFRTKIRR